MTPEQIQAGAKALYEGRSLRAWENASEATKLYYTSLVKQILKAMEEAA